jgi:RES domain-containing protein
MPRVWRISNYPDLTGTGGRLYGARWHTAGRPIIYTAESPAGALIEFLVHIRRQDLPVSFLLLGVDVDERVTSEAVEATTLPPEWAANSAITREIGDRWLASAASLLLYVPSAILPYTRNVLINPAHQQIGMIGIATTDKVPLDERLGR